MARTPSALAALALIVPASCAAPDAPVAPLTRAVWRDSVRLVDSDSFPIQTPSGLTRLADGRFVVADFGAKQLRIFDAGGRALRSIGRRGRGPGEFVAPSALDVLGAEEIVVLDVGTQRVSVVDVQGGTVGRSARLLGQGLDLRVAHGVVHVAIPSALHNRAFATWDMVADTTVARGVMPALYDAYPRLRRNLGLSVLASGRDGLWVGLLGSNSVALHPREAVDAPVRTVELPRRVRRGVPVDRPEWLQREMAYEEELQSVSVLTALAELRDGRIAAVHQDITLGAQSASSVAYLTILDPASGAGCIDLLLPLRAEEMPVLRFIDDRLYAARVMPDGDDVATWVHSLDVAALPCR